MNKPFSHIYSMDDPRFFFPTTPGDGSILYYSTVYNKWTGSDTAQFSWDAVNNILKLKGNLRLVNVSDSNFYDFVSSSSVLYLQYNGADTGTSFYTNGNMTSKGYIITDLSVPTDDYRLIAYSGRLRIQFNNAETGIGFDSTGTIYGNLTGSASLIDTTLTTTNATYFIPFVASSATSTAGQTLRTDAGITYNPSNNNFEVLNGVITSDSFVGSLTGSATLIDTTSTSTNAEYFIPFVASSATSTAGQTLRTDAAITYNPSTNSLTSPNINITFEDTFSSTITASCLNCFNSTFQNYEIQIRFTASPVAFSSLLLRLASSTGIQTTTNYGGQISTLASFTSATHATSSFTISNLPSNSQTTMSWTIFNPNETIATTIKGTNIGSTSASFIQVPQVVVGHNTLTTAFPSIAIVCSSAFSAVITVRGFN